MFLSDALKIMKSLDENKNPILFDIEIRTGNRYNKTGGRYVIHMNAELLQPPKRKGVKRLSDPTPFKNPNHFKNHTRNIKVAGDIITINIFFIIRLNGILVIL
ncbi:hypothetical protein [Chryseobacterium sp. MEBOG07]|uniref:hypothetical protein n=1 Tax=Chryseobacterium sp. MEBOG07 TaxID=2879939 RepID=UPI001F1856A8|nr:hypothetical protein [Chryseobacterium sp. MEBOG07]UKB81257.1 hypothetical protein LF886_09780 [Chryseobacterium sp. MEBOG07]